MTVDDKTLMEKAKAARAKAHAPYSGYFVGSAVVDEVGGVHLGCNVENAAYPQGSCAEATAIGAMVTAGGKRIDTIAVAGGGERLEACMPCGGCRQRILEFADEATRIITLDEDGGSIVHTMAELLPGSTAP